MFSQSEGPQQSVPTAGTLAAAAPAAEAVTGTHVFPVASSKGVAEAPASSAGAASVAVPAAAPVTGGAVFLTASVGGAAKAPASADATVALTTAPSTGGTVPSATSVGGAEISAAEPAFSGTVPSAASIRGAVGARESSIGAASPDTEAEATPSTGGTAALAASTAREARVLASAAGSAGEICGERGACTHTFDPGTVFPLEVHYYNGSWLQHGSSSMAAAAAAAAATITPVTATHGGMQPVLEHCCGPLIQGNYAGGVQGEKKRFSVWISLLTAGKHGGGCSMEGDGLRVEGEFLFLFGLSRERLENCVLETALVSCCSAHENHEEGECMYVCMYGHHI